MPLPWVHHFRAELAAATSWPRRARAGRTIERARGFAAACPAGRVEPGQQAHDIEPALAVARELQLAALALQPPDAGAPRCQVKGAVRETELRKLETLRDRLRAPARRARARRRQLTCSPGGLRGVERHLQTHLAGRRPKRAV